jgi:hypothetical protein
VVLGFEIWTMLQPNSVLDVTDYFSEKLELVSMYRSQTATVDYVSLCRGLASARAFYNPTRGDRSGAVEAFFSLPNHEYCDLVRAVYGEPGQLRAEAALLF